MAVLATGVVPRPPLLAAADPPWHPVPCPTGGTSVAAPAARARATVWYRLDGILDGRGSLAGQRLLLGELGGSVRRMELPPESFASGPEGGRIVVGADDGTRSAVSIVDIARGCAVALPDEADVVRSALLEPDGGTLWEHRVDRATRADRGVWRIEVADGTAEQALPGVAPADPYGRTYATELRWSTDGRLAVTSCGELRCRTRLLDRASGHVDEVGPTGPVVGVVDGVVVAHDPCPGVPCALIALSRGGGARTLVREAGRAAIAGDRVVFEDGAGLGVVEIARGGLARVRAAAGLVPLADGSLAGAGVTHDGRDAVLAPSAGFDPAALRVLAAGTTVPAVLPEVAP